MKTPDALTRWTTDESSELYGIQNWGAGYFRVASNGHIVITPDNADTNRAIDLFNLVQRVQQEGFSVPMLLRFSDILTAQTRLLHESFRRAIHDAGYQGEYRCLYPIKVNQKHHVVRDILRNGAEFHHGLEAGSKAELIAAIACMHDTDAFVVCNGYKDDEFLDLALWGRKLGLRIFIVIEMPGEVGCIIERAKRIGIKPLIGVRAKLSSRGAGHWETSGGDRSKFGLEASQIIGLMETLKQADMLDSLQMLHYHLGSQVHDIRRIRSAVSEAARCYADLIREGAPMNAINIGGGLAVDYDGSQTNFASSRNYTVNEYAADVVEAILNVVKESDVPHPTIVSESGRASVAHHSVLVFNALDVRRFDTPALPSSLPESAPDVLRNILWVSQTLTPRNFQEAYHDALHYRDQIRTMFYQGRVSLREKGIAENIFWYIISSISRILSDEEFIPDEMERLTDAIADVYYCNFSLFQSLPDAWAVQQLFPIMPIHRLDEKPTRNAVLADITCDSDGKINKFIDLRDVRRTLPLHEINDEEYYIGVFLVGAYQETLGDMHNLLGDTNVVHVAIDDDGNPRIDDRLPGDSVRDVLSYVDYDADEVLESIRRKAEEAESRKDLSSEERQCLVQAFEEGMQGYTYFER